MEVKKAVLRVEEVEENWRWAWFLISSDLRRAAEHGSGKVVEMVMLYGPAGRPPEGE